MVSGSGDEVDEEGEGGEKHEPSLSSCLCQHVGQIEFLPLNRLLKLIRYGGI